MKVEIFIHFIETLNDEIALLSKLLKPEKVILISSEAAKSSVKESFNPTKLSNVVEFMKKEVGQTEIIQILYKEQELDKLEQQLLPYLKKHVVINLAGATPLEMMIVTALNNKYEMVLAYPNIKDNTLYLFEKGNICRYNLSETVGNLSVNDFLNVTGGSILRDERVRYQEMPYQKMLEFLLDHYQTGFAPIRGYFKPSYVKFSSGDEIPFYFTIDLKQVNPSCKEILLKFLEELVHMGWVDHNKVLENEVKVYATSKEMEHYLTSGAWLEHVTYHYVSQIIKEGDVHTGFKFAWEANTRYIHNEIDVIATEHNKLIGISCKDTANYDYQTLNELAVYMMKLGGPLAIKILVVTHLPLKKSTVTRAKEMEIELIHIEDDLQVLEERLRQIMTVK